MSVVVTVLVDGKVVADSSSAFDAGDLTVMMGLALDWGRDNVVDQPSADSASAQIAQRGGHQLLQQLRVGQTLEIQASGTQYPDPDVPGITDGGFETGAVGQTPANTRTTGGAAQITNRDAHTGVHSLQLVAADPTRTSTLLVAPDAFSSVDPSAWDAFPKTDAPGQDWLYSVALRAPAGAQLTVQPVLFSSPTGTYTVAGTPTDLIGSGDWQEIGGTLHPATPDRWVGMLITARKTGPVWAEATGTWADAIGRWVDYQTVLVDDVSVTGPAEGVIRTVLVFTGRVTDLEARYDRALGGGSLVADLTARSFPADLQNNRIGDEPWPVEQLGDRVDKILQLAGGDVSAIVDPTISGILVTYRDVDSQPAAGLISELAASAAGVAWSAAHITTGPYYWLEDPDRRASLYSLQLIDGLVEIVDAGASDDAITLSASNVLLDPLRWVQQIADIGTRADITWLEQGVDDDGKPTTTERHQVVIDHDIEQQYGTRGISLSTQLQSSADAASVAQRMLARVEQVGWRLTGVQWDQRFEDTIDQLELKTTLNLLDGTVRIGHLAQIDNIPAWAPLPDRLTAYIEGGHYEYTHTIVDGRDSGSWSLELTLTQGTGIGVSVPWNALDPTWTWAMFDPAISWTDLIGVGP